MAHPHTDACAPPQDSVTLRPSHTLPRAHRGVRRVASPLASPPFAHSCQWNFHRESQWVVALLSLLKTSSLVPTELLPQPFTLVPESSSQMRAVASVLSSALCPSFFTLSLQVLIPFQSEHITAFHCPDGGQTAVRGIRGVSPGFSLSAALTDRCRLPTLFSSCCFAMLSAAPNSRARSACLLRLLNPVFPPPTFPGLTSSPSPPRLP